MHILVQELKEWFDAIVFAVPGGLGRALRGALYGARMQSCGPGLRIGLGGMITGTAAMQIGADCHFGRCNTLLADVGALIIGDRVRTNGSVTINASVAGAIRIGDDVLIGPNVVIRSASHRFDDPARLIGAQGHRLGRIQIGSDVWLAANVVVLPSVTIGAGAVVAAGAVVTRDVPPLAVVAGVPARQIGLRGDRRAM